MKTQWLGLGAVIALGVILGACNGGGGTDGSGSAVPAGISLLAGPLGGPGQQDGTGSAARFHSPQGVVVDSAGNLFVADSENHTIRKITPSGAVSTFAGSPGVTGTANGSDARFNSPRGLAIDGNDNLFVADTVNSAIRKITPAGVVSTLAGKPGVGGSSNGSGEDARFNSPRALAIDSTGNLFVADTYNELIRKVTPGGDVTTFAGGSVSTVSFDGNGTSARFFGPAGLAFDAAGNLYVADSDGGTIRRITPTADVTTVAGVALDRDIVDGDVSVARFWSPTGLVFDSAGNLYITDIYRSVIRKLTPGGNVSTIAGTDSFDSYRDDTGTAALFYYPAGLAIDADDNLYVADMVNSAIRRITPGAVVTTVAGRPEVRGFVNGLAAAARFQMPTAVAADASGNVYVADNWNRLVRKIDADGNVSTLAGIYGAFGSSDGTTATALFKFPAGVAVDSNGNVYVADGGNNTIRKITPGGDVSTLAGKANTVAGSTPVDGTGEAARFGDVRGLAADLDGNLYVVDYHAIRKVTPGGAVTTLAGRYSSGSEDSTGTDARFYEPNALAVDAAGNVYVADTGNHTVRKITPAGVVTTLAGTATAYGHADGSGAAARFNYPKGLTVDAAGNVIVADSWNFVLRKITPGGAVTTVAGTPGVPGVVTGGLPGSLGFLYGVTTDRRGAYYVIVEQSVLKVGLP